MKQDFWALSKEQITYRINQIPKMLLAWYDTGNRSLPWRDSPTPYRVWVSEIMLQQTRVQAALPYFERFVQELPDVRMLANAPEERLMKLWEGLGYYSRARNLQRAAQKIVEEYGGMLPDTAEELQKLPGIGEYTAGAIASIAYQKRVPAVDGNVLRVLSRVFQNPNDVLSSANRRQYRALLEKMIPDRPGDFNQALMELGAIVCLPNGEPHCDACPLAELCLAHQEGCETEFPVKQAKPQRRIEEHQLTLIVSGNTVLLKKRQKSGVLAGLWAFFTMYDPEEKGLCVLREEELPRAKHVFTHVEWHLSARAIYVAEQRHVPGGVWATLSDIQGKYAIPSAYRAYTKLLPRLLG